ASVVLPAGPGGPAFMIFSNFNVLLRYNNSENYGLGVGYLSDRLAGGGPLRGRFPPDDDGLTIDDRKEIQRRLTARGYDTGGVDGVLGKKSEAAIREWQAAQGVAVTGRPSRGLLAQLGG
ncbi:peptidoglycan-binding domain-containing protein, partial [Aquicoccus porphyridii]|uniref:peptidoglycan-binding domain-containing protein n=1 Tax=Aquicoccus porphyridii TaxID=1852029 RepID=UPI00273E1046